MHWIEIYKFDKRINSIKTPHVSQRTGTYDVVLKRPCSVINPVFLLRTSEKNAVTSNDGNRLILKKDDKHETHFMNVLFSKIAECFCKVSDSYSEFIVNVHNTYYKITVLN